MPAVLSRLDDALRKALPRSGSNFMQQLVTEVLPADFWSGAFTDTHEFLFSKYLCAVPMTGPRYETGFDFRWVYEIFCKYMHLFDLGCGTFKSFAHLHIAYMYGHLYPVEENIPRYLWTPLLGEYSVETCPSYLIHAPNRK